MTALSQYRIEHHHAGWSTVLAFTSTAKPHHNLLAPFASRLLHDGGTGTVALVDQDSGDVVARRQVKPPASPTVLGPERKRSDRAHRMVVLRGRSPNGAAYSLRSLMASHSQRGPARPRRSPHLLSSAPLVLVVVDDAHFCQMLTELLTAEGLRVVCASDDQEACDLVAREVPALVVDGIGVPRVHDHGVIRQLRDNGHAMPVVFIKRPSPLGDPAGRRFVSGLAVAQGVVEHSA